MDLHTSETRRWLDQRYSRKDDGQYYAHQPIYGYDSDGSEPNAILRLARTYHVLRILGGLKYDSLLDVGGGEGYLAALTRDLYGAECVSTDLSIEACLRSRELFSINSATSDASRLPFLDNSFDVVLCSEVIEHLHRPVLAISELQRVARKYAIITTSEYCPTGEFERSLRMYAEDYSYPHAERNWYTPDDFKVMLGNGIVSHSQMDNLGGRSVEYFSTTQLSREQVEHAIDILTTSYTLDVNRSGVIVIAPRIPTPEFDELELSFRENSRGKEILKQLLDPYPLSKNSSSEEMLVDQKLVARLKCLSCDSPCLFVNDQIVCENCSVRYQVSNGVPVMLLDDTMRLSDIHHDEYAISNLSRGDPLRAVEIDKLMKYLHGERPVCTSTWRRSFARIMIRLLWLVKRPEPLSMKLKRIGKKMRLIRMNELEEFEKAIAG